MKIRNIIILGIPVLFMVIVNEYVRISSTEVPYSKYGVTAINSVNADSKKCTWICHNNTNYCKDNHVKHLKNKLVHTDILYFGIIGLLASTGNYGLANILFLVILAPLWVWYFTAKSIDTGILLYQLKRNRK